MALTFTDEQWEKIHHAHEGLKKYNRARELENRAKQPDLSAQSYDGMPSSPSPGNYQENQVVNQADDAWKYAEYQKRIDRTLKDVIYVENPQWYDLIVRRYFKHQTAVKIYMDLHISQPYYNQKLDQALLHFDDSCKLDLSIFD